MSEPDDWPNYLSVHPTLLHAVGVISLMFSNLERSIEILYVSSAAKDMPEEYLRGTRKEYLDSNEKRRDIMLRDFFSESNLRDLTLNLLDCFDWCRDSRHKILHSERYPASFSAEGILQLTKRENKQSDTSIYMAFNTKELRAVADKMHDCVMRSAALNINLRYGGQPNVPARYRPYIFVDDVPLLVVPPALMSAEHPL